MPNLFFFFNNNNRVELKKMERAYGLHLVFDIMTKQGHNSDGIIWTPVKCPYVPGICDKL